MPSPDAPAGGVQALTALRTDLAGAEYRVDTLTDVLGPVAAAALHREQPAAPRVALSGSDSPAAVLARLFVLGDPVAVDLLAAALPRTTVAGAGALGLVEVSVGEARALVDLRPYAATDSHGTVEWWLASDLGTFATGRPVRPDHVLGVGGASTTLAQLTVRRPAERVLDVGTGCGVQALHATRHARSVTATDVSARALGFARFNAALADVTLDLRRGSLLDPVEDGSFDLVVSNPPFVITPRDADVPGFEYRDAGLAGDDVTRRLVTGVSAVLAPGGIAQMLGNWEHHDGCSWSDRVGTWLDESGVDGWVVQRQVMDPAEYAETWVRDAGVPSGPGFDAMVTAWLSDFAARGVVAVGFGYVTLRRPRASAPPMRRLEEHDGAVHLAAPPATGGPLGQHIATCLAHHDLLRGLTDDDVLARRWKVAGDVTEERHHVPGAPEPSVVLLRQNCGFRRAVAASGALAGAVGACDGELPLGAITAAVATLLDLPEGDVRRDVVTGVRRLVADALVLPA